MEMCVDAMVNIKFGSCETNNLKWPANLMKEKETNSYFGITLFDMHYKYMYLPVY